MHAQALAAWRECRTKAQQIEDPEQRAAALRTLAGERPVHPYLGGLSLTALRQGNRRMLAPIRTRHADARAEHAETLAAWKTRRTKAQQIEDPEQRAAALDALKRERPTHPALLAVGCAVVSAVVLAGIPAVRQHAGAILGGGLTLWLITALILGNTTAPEKPKQTLTADADVGASEAADEDQEEEPETTVPTPADAHRLTASLTARETSVLLTRLASDLAANHPGWEASTKAVRTLLSEAGIPVRAGVRTPDGNGPGIHHQDVPPLPSPSQTAPVPHVVANVGAGQSANANANNTDEWSTREGFVMRADPDNPARTIIVGRATAA
ncbi:hypothetical protein ACIRD3_25865 [Kitasatospora sp. NPDC093550]|uniref:hypothetical protein n=1 Tax=Kitasatospora sp. NPDC093550 TaxID=3364089 RepID=UPI003802626B